MDLVFFGTAWGIAQFFNDLRQLIGNYPKTF